MPSLKSGLSKFLKYFQQLAVELVALKVLVLDIRAGSVWRLRFRPRLGGYGRQPGSREVMIPCALACR